MFRVVLGALEYGGHHLVVCRLYHLSNCICCLCISFNEAQSTKEFANLTHWNFSSFKDQNSTYKFNQIKSRMQNMISMNTKDKNDLNLMEITMSNVSDHESSASKASDRDN